MPANEFATLLFLLSAIVGAVYGGISVSGARSRIFWGFAFAFVVASLIYLRWMSTASVQTAIETLWSLGPIIGVVFARLVTGGRKPLERAPSKKELVVNPGLTAEYLNGLVSGKTALEAKRNISRHAGQLVELKGEVKGIRENWNGEPIAEILGLSNRSRYPQLNAIQVTFKGAYASALETISPGDWITFKGEVEHSDVSGWNIVRADFVGRAEPSSRPTQAEGEAASPMVSTDPKP